MQFKFSNTAPVHRETHGVDRGSYLREFILGSQDGIVNVLGIVLGVAAGTGNTSIVILAGLAATFAESISMAAVGYTSSKATADFYRQQQRKELREIENIPELEREEIRRIYMQKGFSGKLLEQVVDTITSNKKVWLETMMQDELHLNKERHHPIKQAIIVGFSAFIGSLIPLAAFFLVPLISIQTAFWISLVLSALLLFVMGAYKGKITQQSILKNGLEIAVIGLLAAAAGFLVGALFGVKTP
ncbi:MAG: VIT1/CCC1 transporter family protein [Candidatus Micrarchaeota archaeon]